VNYNVPCALHINLLRYQNNNNVIVDGYAEGICVLAVFYFQMTFISALKCLHLQC
jgi:hypothetical protein